MRLEIIALLSISLTVPAFAEEPRAIEEIVVTAQKREQSIEEVPISITALTGTFLKEAGIGGVHELVRHTPNVHFATSPCCSTIFIRGFGSPFQAGAFDPTVSLVLDELSIPKDIYLSDPLYDIERFEVLRGPQGSLFGKNTPAGLFNVTTAGPTEEFTGTILGRLGDGRHPQGRSRIRRAARPASDASRDFDSPSWIQSRPRTSSTRGHASASPAPSRARRASASRSSRSTGSRCS